MLDLAAELHRWMEEGRALAVATVVAVGGSAPRGPGAALAVDSEGTVIGSVARGCVEVAVYDLCVRALHDGETVVERFGYSDEDAFAVGLTCGGIIDVMVPPVGTDAPAGEPRTPCPPRSPRARPGGRCSGRPCRPPPGTSRQSSPASYADPPSSS